MRHWCAIARLIETKIETGNFDVFKVKNWLGHEEQNTTDKYIHFAEMYYSQYPESWIHNAFRSHKKCVGGKHQGKNRVCKKRLTLPRFSPVSRCGPEEI
jgi:oxalate decarboxylase/phosphoglucose isomerase-like protein (cupin superfamily)